MELYQVRQERPLRIAMIAIDNEIVRVFGAEGGIVLSYLMPWTQLSPIPGPPGDWADHLPFTKTKITRITNDLIAKGAVTTDGATYQVDRVAVSSLTNSTKPKRVRKRSPKLEKSREMVAELVAHFGFVTGIKEPDRKSVV